MRIHIVSSKKKPAMGDKRTTKKRGEQVRIPVVHSGMWVVSNGRQCYEWATLEEAEKRGFGYLAKKGQS